MTIPTKIKIYEVSPRDGLQNEKDIVPTNVKLDFIQLLADSGLKNIEATSFVSPEWVPQLADHKELMEKIIDDGVNYSVLVPNTKGMEDALEVGVKHVAVFGAASNTFSEKNINCSIAESLERFKPVLSLAKENNIKVRGYVSCALGCPYEGDVAVDEVLRVASELYAMGCYEISIADTIGVGTPVKAQKVIEKVSESIGVENIAVHFHDTYGQALANIFAVLQLGVSTVDSSVAGLGGCPYAKGASGNVATEDVIYMLNGMGVETGVDLEKIIAAGRHMMNHLGRAATSRVSQVYTQDT